MTRTSICGALVLLCSGITAMATPFDDLILASTEFLDSLEAGQRSKAVFRFNDEERFNWHYVPKARAGLPMKEMNATQRELALNMLRAVLSDRGYETVKTIRNLENVLKALEGSAHRDKELYYFTFFGEPSASNPWGFRYEGHHTSLHWTMVNGKIVASVPQFLGANPADVREGPMKGTRALAAEEDLGRQLVKSLNDEQRAACILNPAAPPDIVTGAQREAAIQDDLGLVYSQMTSDQQGLLLSLIQVYAHTQCPELAEARLTKIRDAGLGTLKFAWMGGLEKGEKHYYRIQGPTFLIEYDNTQSDANHIHTVWRDFNSDFGRDVLKEHYQSHADPEHRGEHHH